jgi:hypothetical protein
MQALTQAQVDSFHYNGFLFPIPALAPEGIADCLAGLEWLETELAAPVADADIKWRSHASAHSLWFNLLIRHPRIPDAVEDVIGPNILGARRRESLMEKLVFREPHWKGTPPCCRRHTYCAARRYIPPG